MLLNAVPASAASLQYQAYFAGLKVGSATVQVERGVNHYRISGAAAARGVAHVFSDWASEFYAEGHIDSGAPALLSYGYEERERNKHSILRIQHGQVNQTRNGKIRPARPIPAGLDVLSAFFVDPGCWPSRQLHTGRHSYRLKGRPSTVEGGCLFQVEDDDGDIEKLHIIFAERDGIQVPIRLSTRGLLRGSILLQGDEPDALTTQAQINPD